jgi:hypothetical protein
MFVEPKILVVAYQKKDEIVVNMLQKLIETKDDLADGQIIGTEDGSVGVVAWKENEWKANRDSGKGNAEKTLLINRVDGYDVLEPIMNVKFNKHGVKYGFSGRKALVIVDGSYFNNKKKLASFKDEIKSLAIPNKDKLPNNTMPSNIGRLTLEAYILAVFMGGLSLPINVLINLALKFIVQGKEKLEQAQLLYGILQLYYNDLDTFMKE